MKKRTWRSGAFRLLSVGGVFLCGALLWGVTAQASKSSCVTCHLDEEMLLENLSEAQGKSSALQSGAG